MSLLLKSLLTITLLLLLIIIARVFLFNRVAGFLNTEIYGVNPRIQFEHWISATLLKKRM